MAELHHFVKVEFTRFKAFRRFTLHLRSFNILVGPNNAGKSTILAAFKILSVAMRRATTRKPEVVEGPDGPTLGYHVDLSSISVAEENIFYNYDDSKTASVLFSLSNGSQLLLHFGTSGHCVLLARCDKGATSPSTFKKYFNCPIGFTPILGPVDHNERLFEPEAARRALFNYTASRNFRNIWYHFPDRFDDFRKLLTSTWPGMDVKPPVIEHVDDKPRLFMFCPEDRIPREIFWAGFGFQVWCQMLTHLVQASDKSIFLIDEPDIYLHSDLQRQLLGILRNLGPDIVIATHSTEIITEAESDDIVLVDKRRESARRIKDPSQVANVFSLLGSNLNPILTQLAKTRKAVFVEGKDFQIVGRFAQRLKVSNVSNRAQFAVVPVEGFNPQRIRNLRAGMEVTLGGDVAAVAILDRDYRCAAERKSICEECKQFCKAVTIHNCKEIENFLLVPSAIDRAAMRKIADRAKRSKGNVIYVEGVSTILDEFAEQQKNHVLAQFIAESRRFERSLSSGKHDAEINEAVLEGFSKEWSTFESRMRLIPGKDAISFVNQHLQSKYSISVTPSAIVDAMRDDEIPVEMRELISMVNSFAIESA